MNIIAMAGEERCATDFLISRLTTKEPTKYSAGITQIYKINQMKFTAGSEPFTII